MRWQDHLDHLGAVLDDLEQQADGLALAERDAVVAEQRVAEYAHVDLAGRLHASLDVPLRLEVAGVGTVAGTLRRVGSGWLLLQAEADEWVVRVPAVLGVRGLAEGAVPPEVRPATARLGLGSALRGVAEARAEVLLHRTDGGLARGLLGRVGADFVEVGTPAEVLPFDALAAVRG